MCHGISQVPPALASDNYAECDLSPYTALAAYVPHVYSANCPSE